MNTKPHRREPDPDTFRCAPPPVPKAIRTTGRIEVERTFTVWNLIRIAAAFAFGVVVGRELPHIFAMFVGVLLLGVWCAMPDES